MNYRKADTVSRQRRWQIARLAEGNCTICGKPSQGRYACDDCSKKYYKVKKRNPLKEEWAAVDWNETDAVIASRLNVHPHAVYIRRRKLTAKKDAHGAAHNEKFVPAEA